MHAPLDRHGNPIDRKRLERFGRLLREAQRRKAKELQSKRGWYDDNGVRQGGLIAFVRYFWKVLEPETKFIDGWCVQAICEHLEAITFGEITRLLINVPPGFAKSILVDCFWPAWEWGPMKKTHYRYVAFSYSASLTERDNDRFRTLISSPEYQALYGPLKATRRVVKEQVQYLAQNGQVELRNQTIIKVMNTRTGWKLASSVGGVATGERGDRIICLPGDQRVLTDRGWLPIGEVVEDQVPVRIAGSDSAGRIVWQPIEKYEVNINNRATIRINYAGGELRCTDDHPVFVESRGFVRADQVKEGETVWTFGVQSLPILRENYSTQTELVPKVLQHQMPRSELVKDSAGSEQPSVPCLRENGLSVARASQASTGRSFLQSKMSRHICHWPRQSDVVGWLDFCSLRKMWEDISFKPSRIKAALSPVLFPTMRVAGEMGPWWASSVASMRRLWQNLQTSVARYEQPNLFPALCGCTSREAYGWGRQWSLRSWPSAEAIPAWVVPRSQSQDTRTGRQQMPIMFARARAASESRCPPYRLCEGEFSAREFDNSVPLVPRSNARQLGSATGVGRAIVQSVSRDGSCCPTYNVRVAGQHNYFAEGVLVHNCDDPHSVQEAESDRIRDETVRWFRESIPSRFNNIDTGALVVIMQRVHDGDVSGVALGPEFDYCHLMIPWEFEPDRIVNEETGKPYANQIGWFDPRLEVDDECNVIYENGELPNEGEPAWPERFSVEKMERLKNEIGEYAWAAQFQQRPAPRGGGLFRRDQWKIWSPEDGRWPQFDYVLASLDAAATEKEENCPSGFTVWGTFRPKDSESNGIMLIDAWRKRLRLHGALSARQGMEIPQLGDDINRRRQRDLMWRNRCGSQWGLVEWIAFSCRYHAVDLLLIESEKTGIAVAQEIERLYMDEGWGVQLQPVKGDKYARALSVQPMFSQGKVWTPIKDWAEVLLDEVEAFPRGRYRDLTDSMTQALRHLRMVGLAPTDEELRVAERERIMHRGGRKAALYPV